MVLGTAPGTRPPVGTADFPTRGLGEVLTGWSGSGGVVSDAQLLALLTAVGPLAGRDWDSQTVVRRARRVLWDKLLPLLSQLPASEREWLEALPATRQSERVVSSRALRPIHWPRTVRANRGWPPPAGWDRAVFVGRRPDRVRDVVLARTLCWTADECLALRTDAYKAVGGRADAGPPSPQLDAMVAAREALRSPAPEPSFEDALTVGRAGSPWNMLGAITDELLRLRRDPLLFAFEILLPDEELRARLFHLAAFGEALVALRDLGGVLVSKDLLRGASAGPAYVADVGGGRTVDCWFEASGCWRYYGGRRYTPTYERATEGVVGYRGDLSPDCLFILREGTVPSAALVLECKFSRDPTYVARDGFLQTSAYSAELATLLGTDILGLVVGPASVVDVTSVVDAYDVTVATGRAMVRLGCSDVSGIAAVLRLAMRL
jgi:hypothetical protein